MRKTIGYEFHLQQRLNLEFRCQNMSEPKDKESEEMHHDEVQWETSVSKRKADDLSEDSNKEERVEDNPEDIIKKKKIHSTAARDRGILNPNSSHITFMDPMNPTHISQEQQTFLGALDSFGAVPISRSVEPPGKFFSIHHPNDDKHSSRFGTDELVSPHVSTISPPTPDIGAHYPFFETFRR